MPEEFAKPILIAGLLACLVMLESRVPFFRGRRWRVRHDVANLALGFMNAVMVWLIFAGGLLAVSEWTTSVQFGLLHLINGPPLLELVLAVVFFDLWQYLWHRLNHQCAWLWRFHAVHHSDAEMDATTAVRFHTVEILLSSGLRLLVIPLLGMGLTQLLVYEMLLLPVIFFHHSNVSVPRWLDRLLRGLIVTPSIHRVHHSDVRHETDSNFASLFSCWDRCFGSQVIRVHQQDIRLGLGDTFKRYDWAGLLGMLRQPFVSKLYR